MSALSAANPVIMVTFDNNAHDPRLATSWGFSCLIRGLDKTILFDTGGSGAVLLDNMAKMGLDPNEVDLVVLSHIHGDHTGGLEGFLRRHAEVTVYLPQSFPTSFKGDVKRTGAKIVEVSGPQPICAGAFSTGEMGSGWGVTEQSLVLQTAKGLVVITGCAHPGIVNIVEKAKEVAPGEVLLVMGGFHLSGHSSHDIAVIIQRFLELGVRYVGPCHCTGIAAQQQMAHAFGDKYLTIGVGSIIAIAELK
ncbi:MAG: MBL fold metallo-hydrolase [Deltaproteobacteria bacterium]|nr:MBL fold metallo-hydrolase [Deltaproteobacteria bacterium]MBW1953697.1 MBL fold metallo-hydrolase [Deltaproteobacteria bacterium]